ncbi:TPA: hypothetical protein ACH3X2_000277 [Trebouxia sp. C0005]
MLHCSPCSEARLCADHLDNSGHVLVPGLHLVVLQVPHTRSQTPAKGVIHTALHQQHHSSAEVTHAAAICGFNPVLLHSWWGVKIHSCFSYVLILAGSAADAGTP